MSIKSRLLALVAVFTIPLVFVVGWMMLEDYRHAADLARGSTLEIADAVRTGTVQLLADAERQLNDVAGVFGEDLADDAACEEAVRTAHALASYLLDLAVVRPDGTLVCSTRAVEPGQEPDVREAVWLTQVLQRGRFTVASPVRGPISGLWVIPLLQPVRDEEGAIVAILGGSVEVDRFQDLLAGVSRQGALVTIVDGDQRVVARSEASDEFVGQQLRSFDASEDEISNGRYIGRGPDFTGVDRTWGWTGIPGPGWYVYAGLLTEQLLGPARAEASTRVLVVGFILLLALVAGFVLQRGIADSLAELRQGVRAAADGGLVRIPEGSPVEVQEVGEQLNRTLAARDEAKAQAQEATERFRSILENAVIGIFISRGDERFLHVNPALVEMLGYESAADLEEIGPRDLFADDDLRGRFASEVARTPTFRQVETQWLRQDGGRITVELTGRVRTDAEGCRIYEVHAQDVTEQRRFERELHQTQKMEAVGRLAGGVAHDFNNLLTVISGNLMLVLEEPGLLPGFKGELMDAHDAAERAGALTRKLLAFSRKDHPEPTVVDADDVARGLQMILARLIPERIDLSTRLGADGVGILADAGQFEQVLMNLVVNARDAISGHGCIEVASELVGGPEAGKDADHALGWYALTVRDDGVGMTDEVRAQIFEPFFTTKDREKGTGLGLATVHAIVAHLGGQITVESKPGKGTLVRVFIPATQCTVGVDATADGDESLWARGETVLVVEDEASVRETIERILERVGYRVITARDGREGLAVIEAGLDEVHLVLCDVVMPELGGLEVSRALARMAPQLPVVLMSGYSADHPVPNVDFHGPRFYMGKPFVPAALLKQVRDVLNAQPVF